MNSHLSADFLTVRQDNMKKLLTLLSAGILLLNYKAQSQVKTVDQSTAWFLLNQNVQLSRKWTIQSSEIFAYVEGQKMQTTWRIGGSYDINKRFSVVPLGYGYTWNNKYGKLPVSIVNNEHMIWQQVGVAQAIGRVTIKHRFRVEERFMQDNKKDKSGNIIDQGYPINQYRFRYRFMANIPLNASTAKHPLFINTWAEGFWSWGQNVTYNAINQKRIFAGVGYQFGKVALIGGYIYQQNRKSNNTRIENNSGFLVQMNYQLKLFSK
jgi:predicted porin